MLRLVTLVVFLHYLLKYKPFNEFFPFQNVVANLCVWLECVCVHPLNKGFSQAVIGTFYQCHFQTMVGWVTFKVSLFFIVTFKSTVIHRWRFNSSFPISISVFFSRPGVRPGASSEEERKKIDFIFFLSLLPLYYSPSRSPPPLFFLKQPVCRLCINAPASALEFALKETKRSNLGALLVAPGWA